jgi:hypothetical protein
MGKQHQNYFKEAMRVIILDSSDTGTVFTIASRKCSDCFEHGSESEVSYKMENFFTKLTIFRFYYKRL